MTLHKKLKIRLFLVNVLLLFMLNPIIASELDDLAACGGVIVGNGAGDYTLTGNEDDFRDAFFLAQIAYLGHSTSNNYGAETLKIADGIFGANTDKIIMAINSETFDSNTYEEVIACYRMIGMWYGEEALDDSISSDTWNRIKNHVTNQFSIMKRVLDAGI